MTLDSFCEDQFWNSSLTWYTEDPELTICFEKTVLVLVPCLFLWLFSPLEIYYLLTSKTRHIPWSWLNITKLFITAVLIVISIVELFISLKISSRNSVGFDVYGFDSVVKLLTVAFSGLLVLYNKKYGMHTSGLLCLFWLFFTICGIPEFRTQIRELQSSNLSTEVNGRLVSSAIYFILAFLMFVLNGFSDKPPSETLYGKSQRPCPHLTASFLSRITFTWFQDMIMLGYKRPIVEEDLWDITHQNSVEGIFPIFEHHWRKNIDKNRKLNRKGSFLPALLKTFAGMLSFLMFLGVINDFLIFANPKILGYLISFAKDKQEMWKGIFYAILLFVSSTTKTLVIHEWCNRNELISMRIRSALIPLLYKKALVISNSERQKRTVGEIMNLMSIDVQRFGDIGYNLYYLWSSSFQIAFSTYLLWQELGPSVLVGIGILVIVFPINGMIAKHTKKFSAKNMKNQDERVKLMNEILGGMRVLKLYAWEKSFQEQVTNVRTKEIKVLRQARYLQAVTTFLLFCSPIMVALASFATYIFMDEKNVFDTNKAFVSLALFNIMRGPLEKIPSITTSVLLMLVSFKRINKFLNAEEVDPNIVQHDLNKEYPVTIEKGTFSWDEQPILKNINLSLKQKTTTAIVGTVGAGKSSLLGAILGEMIKVNGRVNTYGKIAYVSQQAWIQNDTLRNNILFGKAFDGERYQKIIEACALKTDFKILPAGDQTEIGEKGINLSGGQKQRISLARALYSDADIYLLDDPLSAVDSHVGKHIFDNVIGPSGFLKHKTKLFVTHAVTYLPQCHQIVVIKDGSVTDVGTYNELLNKKGDFAEYISQYSSEKTMDEGGSDPEINQTDHYIKIQDSRFSLNSQGEKDFEFQSNGSLVRKTVSITEKLSMVETDGEKKVNKFRLGQDLIEKEIAETGNVTLKVYRYYFSNVGFDMLLLILGIQIVTQCFDIASNAWLGKWSGDDTIVVDNVVNTGKRDMYLGVYGAIGVVQASTIIIDSIVYTIATLRAGAKIHNNLLKKVMRFPMYFFDVTPIGRILARFSNDVNDVDITLPNCLQTVFGNTIKVFGTLGVISYSTPWFLVVIIPITVLYYILQRLYIASHRQLRRLVAIFRAPLYSHFGETLTGAQTIRAYGQKERFNLQCHSKVNRTQAGLFPQLIAYRWFAVRLEMLGNLITFFAALFAVLARNMSPGLVGLSLSYAMQITQILKNLINMVSIVETTIVSVERIKEYQDLEEEAAWEKNENVLKSWPTGGCLEFKKYGIRYREGLDLVLKDLNIQIDAGYKVGIVGRTGAGKSSLALGLFRLIEAAEGRIEIDGVNIADLGLEKLRSSLTIIPQDPVLFAGTLRINLDPFDKYSDSELWKALELAHLKHFVESLPDGLYHQIHEGGQNLSTGQKQLICLARALLRKTKILVLDEATAAIDLETDDLIQETIRKEFSECTVLTIAHRLNTIMDSDRIVVLDKGRIVEYDSPTNLLANTNTIFYGMCKDAGLC